MYKKDYAQKRRITKQYRELRERMAKEISCIQVANDILGMNVQEGDRPKELPFDISNGKNKDAFVFYPNGAFCYTTHEKYSIFDLVSLYKFNDTKHFAESFRIIADRYGYELPGESSIQELSDQEKKERDDLEKDINSWHKNLNDEVINYLTSRHITPDTIDKLKIGYRGGDIERSRYNDRIIVPCLKDGQSISYVARALHNDNVGKEILKGDGTTQKYSKYEKMYNTAWNETMIFGLDTLNRDNKYLVISEGMFDYLSVYQEGISTLSSATGASNKDINTIIDIMRSYKNYEYVLLANDNDPSGQRFNNRIAKRLIDNHIKFAYIDIPKQYNGEPCKDISDYYTSGGDLKDLFGKYNTDGQNNMGAVCYFASIDDLHTLGKELKRYCTWLTSDDVILLFSEISKQRDIDDTQKKWWKSLLKQCQKAPTEKYIKDCIIDRYDIIYSDLYQTFFIYNGKYWEKKSDLYIKRVIADLFGMYETDRITSATLGLLKTCTNDEHDLDYRNCINFTNGTLDLLDQPSSDGKYYKFRRHDKYDYCTSILPYAYNPGSKNEVFEQYLDNVTDHNKAKQDLLKELMGYTLFNNNSLHRWAILLGRGQNGKSIFTDTLYKLFENATSNIPLDKFDDDRYMFNMIGKRLNICGDEKPTLGDGVENLKKVVGGNAITIRPLHKRNSVEFIPRVKLIACVNRMPYTKDQTNGIMDKTIIIDFPLHYVDQEEMTGAPNERIKDIYLQDKINANLSGVFNVALEGYQRLMTSKKFSVTAEQKIMRKEFETQSNNVLAFLDQLDILGNNSGRYSPTADLKLETGVTITCSQMYNLYLAWCDDEHIEKRQQRNKRQFLHEVRELIPTDKQSLKYIDKPSIRIGNKCERGFVYYYTLDKKYIN